MLAGEERRKKGQWDKEMLLRLSSHEFEQVIAALWEAMGYDILRGPIRGADAGIDILARTKSEPKITVGIQAKAYGPGRCVGVREIREYASLKYRSNIDIVIIVTTSDFTDSAKREAEELGVKIIGSKKLLQLLNRFNVPCISGKRTGDHFAVERLSEQIASVESDSEDDIHDQEIEEVQQIEAKKESLKIWGFIIIGLGFLLLFGIKEKPEFFVFSLACWVIGIIMMDYARHCI